MKRCRSNPSVYSTYYPYRDYLIPLLLNVCLALPIIILLPLLPKANDRVLALCLILGSCIINLFLLVPWIGICITVSTKGVDIHYPLKKVNIFTPWKELSHLYTINGAKGFYVFLTNKGLTGNEIRKHFLKSSSCYPYPQGNVIIKITNQQYECLLRYIHDNSESEHIWVSNERISTSRR